MEIILYERRQSRRILIEISNIDIEPSRAVNPDKIIMATNLTMNDVINAGKKLADANMVVKFKAGSHSHNAELLFPQTEAQYRWLKKNYGTTANVVILKPIEDVLNVCPELARYVKPTKSGRFSRIEITL